MNDFTSVLAADLADLASTMPADPGRLGAVRRRARHLRSRQLATRGVSATATVALAVGGLAAVQRGGGNVQITPAGAPTPSTLPSCASVPTTVVQGPKDPTVAGDRTMVKGLGTISALPDADTVVVTSKALPADLTFDVTGDTEVVDGSHPGRPALHVGDTVGFVLHRTTDAGPWTAVHLETNPATSNEGPKVGTGPGGAKVPSDVEEWVKGRGTVHAPADGSPVSIAVTDGPMQREVIAFTVDETTEFTAGDTPCARPPLAEGADVSFVARKVGAGYHLDRVLVR